MATQVQFRRGTTSEHSSFTGAVGEVTVDTTLDTIRVHDGSTAGGTRIAKFSEVGVKVVGDDSATLTITPDDTLRIAGGDGITTSTDSAGTLSIAASSDLVVNSLESTDSTTITVKDNLAIQGKLIAEDSSVLNIDGGISVIGASEFSGAITSGGAVTGTSFVIGSADINETDLEQIDGLTAGTVAASKAVVVDANKDAGDFRNVTLSGTLHTTTLDVREILSTDSTFITVNEGLEVLGTIQCNEITSSDSSEVTINNLRTQVITANDSTEILVNDAMRVSGLITGTATQAQYADLAERYTADATYGEGHVMVIGGSAEITESNKENDTKVAGVISEQWAFLMNQHEDGPAVALKGKVQCKVVGSVSKGDALVTSNTAGLAVASDSPNPLCVIGRSLVDDADTHPRKILIKI